VGGKGEPGPLAPAAGVLAPGALPLADAQPLSEAKTNSQTALPRARPAGAPRCHEIALIEDSLLRKTERGERTQAQRRGHFGEARKARGSLSKRERSRLNSRKSSAR
jgi:hypothetical protein